MPDFPEAYVEEKLIENAELQCRLLPEVVAHLLQMKMFAKSAGFDLRVASGYRSVERQLSIWNAKARGDRPVLDINGIPLDISALSEQELIFAILRWSALPGASRHHWGTDFDIYDASKISADYKLQLTQAETQGDGPFAEFHGWLSDVLASGSWNFFRPYDVDRGGVAPEPWHLSYAPLAREAAQALTLDNLRLHIEQLDIALKPVILENLNDIYARFVRIDRDYP